MNGNEIRKDLIWFFDDRMMYQVESSSENLFDTGIFDSMMLVDIVTFVEQRYSIAVEIEDLETDNFATIDKIADFVSNRVGKICHTELSDRVETNDNAGSTAPHSAGVG